MCSHDVATTKLGLNETTPPPPVIRKTVVRNQDTQKPMQKRQQNTEHNRHRSEKLISRAPIVFLITVGVCVDGNGSAEVPAPFSRGPW